MKYLSLIIFLALSCFAEAQDQVEVLVNSGHAKKFEDIDISKDDEIMAILGQDGIITIWDIQNNIQLQRIVNSSTFQAQYIELTPDGKFLFIYSYKRGVLEKYDINSKQIVDSRDLGYASFSQCDEPHLSISPDGNSIIFLENNDIVMAEVNDLSSTIATVENIFSGEELRFSDHGNLVIYRNYKGIQLFNPEDLSLKQNWQFPDSLGPISHMYCVYFSPKGNEVVFVDTDYQIFSYNLLDGTSNMIKINKVTEVHFSQDNQFLYFLGGNASGNRVYVYEPKMKTYVNEIYVGNKGTFDIIKISDDNSRLYVTESLGGRSIKVFDIKTGTLIHKISGDIFSSHQLSLSHDGTQLHLTGSFDNKTWDLTTGLIKTTNDQYISGKSSGSIVSSKSGKYKAMVNQSKKYKSINIGRGMVSIVDSSNQVLREIYKKSTLTESMIFDPQETNLWVIESQLKTRYLHRFALDSSSSDLRIEIPDNGSIGDFPPLLFTPNANQIIVDTDAGFSVFDCKSGELIKRTDQDSESSFGSDGMMITNDGSLFLRATTSGFECYNTENWTLKYRIDEFRIGMRHASKWAGSDYFALFLKNGNIDLLDPETGKIIKTVTESGAQIIHSTYDPVHNNYYTLGLDGEIKLWDTDLGKSKLKMIPTKEDGFFILDHDNMYMASKEALDMVHFKYKGEILTFESLDITNNQPHKILQTIGVASEQTIELFKSAFDKRLNERGFNEVPKNILDNIPRVSITSEVPVSTNDSILYFDVIGESAGSNLNKFHCYLNGARLTGKGGLLVDDPSRKIKDTYFVALGPGLNHIQVGFENSDGQISALKSMFVVSTHVYEPKQTYIVTVGISDYHDQKFNLEYPSKDVYDITEYFKSKYPDSTLHIMSLTDKEASSKKLEEITEFIGQAKQQDELIVFIAGHGVLDQNFDYYFAPYDFDFDKPNKKGWKYEQLEELFDYCAARQRLLLIDACHSGAIDKDAVFISDETTPIDGVKFRGGESSVAVTQESALLTFQTMNESFADLRSLSGTFVLSSAGGTEYAFESDQWNNGVFTYAMIEGLRKRTADEDKNQQIDVFELTKYVEDRVIQLTNGAQQPNLRETNLWGAFEIK